MPPDKGNVRWQEAFGAFHETGHKGWMVVEAFRPALPAIAAATKIGRRMYDTGEQLARDALAFMTFEVNNRR